LRKRGVLGIKGPETREKGITLTKNTKNIENSITLSETIPAVV